MLAVSWLARFWFFCARAALSSFCADAKACCSLASSCSKMERRPLLPEGLGRPASAVCSGGAVRIGALAARFVLMEARLGDAGAAEAWAAGSRGGGATRGVMLV